MKKIHGFINVDALAAVNPDSIQDVFTLPQIENNSVDLLYACHVLEHSTRKTYADVLKRWYEVIKPGGIIRLAVPDIEAAMLVYLGNRDLAEISGFLWGGQRNEYDHHGVGFDFVTLSRALRDCGFADVWRYDWRKTEHHYVDDYSQAYLPHMDKVHGRLMSLNVEAMKAT
jgi:SAM-dependent methyltransferase